MITVTCKCGKSTMTFNNLTEKDFPNGWETDCCMEVPKSVQKRLEIQKGTPEQEAHQGNGPIEADMIIEAAEAAVEKQGEVPVQYVSPERKKPGRKPKA